MFQRYTQTFSNNGIVGWNNGNATSGNVEFNNTTAPITIRSQTWQPRTLSIHNGQVGSGNTSNANVAVVRFTAPATGVYTLSGSFYPGDTSANTTVEIFKNWDTSTSSGRLFDSTRAGNATVPFTISGLALQSGNTVDFAVGGQYYFGDTGLNVTITRQ